jgi:hypothetical protein
MHALDLYTKKYWFVTIIKQIDKIHTMKMLTIMKN